MKISKQVENKIRDAIAQLDTGIAFIDHEKTRVVRLTSCATMPADSWSNKEGIAGLSINKQIGSDLCYLRNARQALLSIVTPVKTDSGYEQI
jgi:hypothetical protein